MNQTQRNIKKFKRENRKNKGEATARKLALKVDSVRAMRRRTSFNGVDGLLSSEMMAAVLGPSFHHFF